MSHDYATRLLVEDRIAGFRHEADQDRLARLARAGRPRNQRWWERLMLFRTQRVGSAHRPAATVAAGESPG
jgi:hypothetical protein